MGQWQIKSTSDSKHFFRMKPACEAITCPILSVLTLKYVQNDEMGLLLPAIKS